jgi:hypothetical protein
MGSVSATQQFVRSLAGVIAAPILGTVLARSVDARLARDLPGGLKQAMAAGGVQPGSLDPQQLLSAQAQQAIRSRFDAGPAGDKLYQQFIDAVHGALASGTRELFTIALVFGVLALVATLFLAEVRLKRDEFFDEPAAASDGPA